MRAKKRKPEPKPPKLPSEKVAAERKAQYEEEIIKPRKAEKEAEKRMRELHPNRELGQHGPSRLKGKDLLKKIFALVRRCVFYGTAFQACGIPFLTWTTWCRRGKRVLKENGGKIPPLPPRNMEYRQRLRLTNDRKLAKLVIGIRNAKAQATSNLVRTVRRASKYDWHAAKWLLQIGGDRDKFREEASAVIEHKHSGSIGHEHLIDISKLTFEKRKALLELLEGDVIEGQSAPLALPPPAETILEAEVVQIPNEESHHEEGR